MSNPILTAYRTIVGGIVEVLSPSPLAGDAGEAVNNNFKALADSVGTLEGNASNYVTKAANLSDLVNSATARNNLGLGSAATHAATDFDSIGSAATLSTALTAHTSDTNNPHSTTKAQVGLGNVQNVDTTSANNISSGTINEARLPSLSSTYLSLSGGSLTGALDATIINIGDSLTIGNNVTANQLYLLNGSASFTDGYNDQLVISNTNYAGGIGIEFTDNVQFDLSISAQSIELVPQSSAPSWPNKGMIYCDSSGNFHGYNGTTWKQFTVT